MRDAIANAAVGDEQKREDPTVNELERRGAEFLGHEEAVFLPTATMANQIALNILGRPGDALLVERHAHIMLSELGGPAAHSGLLTIGLEGTKGRFSPEQVVAEVRDRTSVHVAPTRVVTIENTHNSSGGRAWPLDEVDAIVSTCREHDLVAHLDRGGPSGACRTVAWSCRRRCTRQSCARSRTSTSRTTTSTRRSRRFPPRSALLVLKCL